MYTKNKFLKVLKQIYFLIVYLNLFEVLSVMVFLSDNSLHKKKSIFKITQI